MRKIIETGNSEVVIKKSTFIGSAVYVESEEAAQKIISDTRKKYYDARHVCYAYSIGEENPRLKFSDDGEPGGTAGKPILEIINNSGIYNILIVVTRYFGGVLLGTGGLVRAYTQAASEAVSAAEIKEVCFNNIYDIEIGYGDFDKIKYILDNAEGVSYDTQYGEKVIINAVIPEVSADAVLKQVSEKTAGKANILLLEEKHLS